MKHQIGTENCGNQVYVITIDDAADGECLRDFLEQQDYTFFTACEESESFRHIQDAMLRPQVSAEQNDSAPITEESPPMTEASGTAGNTGIQIGFSRALRRHSR